MFGYVTSFDTEKNVQRTWMIILEYFTCDVSNDTSNYLSTYMNILIRRIFGVSRIFGISFQLQRHQLPVDTIEVYISYLQIWILTYPIFWCQNSVLVWTLVTRLVVNHGVWFEAIVFAWPSTSATVSTTAASKPQRRQARNSIETTASLKLDRSIEIAAI